MSCLFTGGRACRWRLLLLALCVVVALRLAFTGLVPGGIAARWYRGGRGGGATTSAFSHWVHDLIVTEYMKKRENWSTSNLGTILFKDRKKILQDITETKTQYKVLVWRAWDDLERRHIYNYGNERLDPLRDCSVRNCVFTADGSQISTADAVLVHLHRDKVPDVRVQSKRSLSQRWIFLSDESPFYTSIVTGSRRWPEYANIFNWSMTYRTDSDIPVPYGRVVPLESARPPGESSDQALVSLIPNWASKRQDALIAILVSNCSGRRMRFVRELMNYMTVHVYGGCSKDKKMKAVCPGHFHSDCPAINNYYFYLAFENASCKQYITGKAFFNAYAKGAIPVVIGTDIESASEILPPYSFIYADKYPNVQTLANVLTNLGNNERDMLAYHNWRRHFEVLNEHGYFMTPSVHYCRVCEALNYNDKSLSIYDEERLSNFLDPKTLCQENRK